MVRGQREKILNGQTGDKRFKDEGWAGAQHKPRQGLDCIVEVYVSKESKKEVTVLQVGVQQQAAPRVRAAKSSEFGEEKL